MYKVIYLLIFATPVLCQYAINTGIRADVTFDDHNERYDLTNLIRQQNKYSSNAFDPQSSEEYRRFGSKSDNFKKATHQNLRKSKSIGRSRKGLLKKIKSEREARINRVLNAILLQIHSGRRNDDFVYHDDMVSDSETVQDFNTNLEKFRTIVKENSGKLEDVANVLADLKTRRSLPLEDEEILMHYAFPINMRVEGFLQIPHE